MIRKNLKMLNMAFDFAPKWVILTFIQNLCTAIGTVLTSVMVVEIVYSGIIGDLSYNKVHIYVITISIFIFGSCVVNSVYYGKYYEIGMQTIKDRISLLINNKASSVDIALFQNIDFLNLHSLMQNAFSQKVIEVVSYLAFYLSNILAIILCLVISATISLHTVIMGCLFIPLLIAVSNRKKSNMRVIEKNRSQYKKRKEYYTSIFSNKEYAEEVRLYPFINIFKEEIHSVSESLVEKLKKVNKKIFFLDLVNQGILEIVVYWGIILYLSFKIVEKTYPVSYLLPTAAVVFQLVKRTNAFVGIGPNLKNFAEYQDYYDNFMSAGTEVDNQQEKVLTQDIEQINIVNLSFRYNEGDALILNNINMQISKGQKIALVGENGAGKTTLIRLLLGLYDNYSGNIFVDGIELRQIDKKKYRLKISYILQTFNIYACSLADNVTLGNEMGDKVKVERALIDADLYADIVEHYENSNPFLTKEFAEDGIELSGGQKQKLAIARAHYRNSSIIFMDEPSSALDPLSEARIFNKMNALTESKSLLVVTHRLHMIRNVDWIYYLENGRIAEQGTHKTLMTLKGRYERMYTKQRERFGEKSGA